MLTWLVHKDFMDIIWSGLPTYRMEFFTFRAHLVLTGSSYLSVYIIHNIIIAVLNQPVIDDIKIITGVSLFLSLNTIINDHQLQLVE